MKKTGLLAAALVCALYASSSHAAAYVSTRTVGSATIYFSLTTDDTLGVITSDNITNYAVTIISGANTINFAPANSALFIFGSQLTATATDLSFNFGGAGNSFLVFNRGAGVGDHYCFETSGCSGQFNSAESFRVGGAPAPFTGEARSGVQVIASVASVSAVPEPATWALMLLGFASIGVGMRRVPRKVLRAA